MLVRTLWQPELRHRLKNEPSGAGDNSNDRATGAWRQLTNAHRVVFVLAVALLLVLAFLVLGTGGQPSGPDTGDLEVTLPSSTTSQKPPTTATTTSTTTTTVFGGPFGQQLLDAPIVGLPETGFGQTEDDITAVLDVQFPGLRDYASNHEDLEIVTSDEPAYLRYRSDVGNNSRTQFQVPIEDQTESYLVYRFMLEPGFDAGDGDGSDGSPSWGTGVKLPGLMRGDAADNTGGNHTAGGFSGRLMIRGTRKSDGRSGLPREGITLSSYIYAQSIDGLDVASGFGRDYYFLNGFSQQPFEGIRSGLSEGVGDERIWDLPVGKWITVVLGYRVDGENGWFKAWTAVDGVDRSPAERLFVPSIDWSGGTDGADSLLFQVFWGGSGPVWYPDSLSYVRFKDFGVFTDERDALHAARTG